MGAVDNELNWRKVFQDTAADLKVTATLAGDGGLEVSPSASIDVSGWTLAERMMLPDWCFPNRMFLDIRLYEQEAGEHEYGIAQVVMPDPMCIWELAIRFVSTSWSNHYIRLGLDIDVPTNAVEMDAADEIFPYIGSTLATPHRMYYNEVEYWYTRHKLRKGMVTGGKYLVLDLYNQAGRSEVVVSMVVSGLPTKVPAFLNPKVS